MDLTAVAQRTELEAAREKFMQLLETDRASADFDRLYAEVDEALARLMLHDDGAAV